ncbi:MAG: chromosome segregation SMC family protein [Candidatus Pacearchaeota archaeon]
MTYIKKMVLHGFKSFANKTEIPFDKTINVIIGPNGSGKSNISDALCFVLGRLSSKSLRASKSSNLIFQGSKDKKPAHEASVELIFDNSNRLFNVNFDELVIKRIVRRNGQSIYKINNETKTRQEVLEILAQGGIDPNGFNLVLQGEIARFIKMHSEERREIIEEIAGISIYESRKQKSLKEIEKTEEKLKEVSAILRERTSYLKNLDEERKQALKFKELEKTIKQCKASIISKKIEEKKKFLESINKEVEKNQKFKSKIKEEIEKISGEIVEFENKINEINRFIQKTTGLERESLNEEVTELKSKIAADEARKENFEKKFSDNEIRKDELESNLANLEDELNELKKESPKISKKQEEIKIKKKELEKVKDEKEQLASLQANIINIKDKIRDKESSLLKIKSESKALYNYIQNISSELSTHTIEECEKNILYLKKEYEKKINETDEINSRKLLFEKSLSVCEAEIERNKKIKEKLPSSDKCPLCQVKLSDNHRKNVLNEADFNIERNKKSIYEINENILNLKNELKKFESEKNKINDEISIKQSELSKLNLIEEKKSLMNNLISEEKEIEEEILRLEISMQNLDKKIQEKSIIEEKYSRLFFELQELSSRTDENLNTTILFKEREFESIENVIKSIIKDQSQINSEIIRLKSELKKNKDILNKKQKSLEELNLKFKKLYDERTKIQEIIKQKNIQYVEKQNIASRFNDSINEHKINLAKIAAEIESLDFELNEFSGIEIISGSMDFLEEKLKKSEQSIMGIGNVNLRALETYNTIKEEYDKISEKVKNLESERNEIISIIEEIDKKKRKTFMKTFNAINELFTRNFSQLSVKGKAFLELENNENIFDGGINITIKVAKGKYFDVTSLSGGEQTLIALSLIFAIQEYKPYSFYVLDEIDAALDKRNSELLAELLKKYIQSGQYLMISHNDSIISGASTIYGVSMNNGISKILSLNLKEKEDVPKEFKEEVKQEI